MPSLRQIVFLFACCTAFPLAGQESGRYVIPDGQPLVSFAPQAPPTAREQLQHVADGFGAVRSATIPLATHTNDPSAPAVISASMGRNDTTSIQTTVFSPAQPNLERTPIDPRELKSSPIDEDEEEEEIVPKKKEAQDTLDTPLVRSDTANDNGKIAKPSVSNGVGSVVTMFASLFIVIATFLILALLFKKVSPKGSGPLPSELIENLGRTSLTPKIQLHLLRLGNRLILVSVTLDGVHPITEITDPDEVVQLLGLCRRLDPNSSTQNFKKMYDAVAAEPPTGGYFGADVDTRPRSKSKATPRTKSSLVDLYSEPDASLTELLANGLKGGRNG